MSTEPGTPPPHERPGELVEELADFAETPVTDLVVDATSAAEPDARQRRRWVLPLRIAISLGLLGLLVWKIPDFDVAELVPTWSASTVAWLAVLLGTMALAVVASALRWQQMLAALGHHVGFGRLVTTTWAGQFVSNVLPTTIGGDVLRIARVARDTGDAPDTFASVALERLTGWLVLPLISLTGSRRAPSTGCRRHSELGAMLGLLLPVTAHRSGNRLGRSLDKLPSQRK